MAERTPLVVDSSGDVEELPSGDTLPGLSATLAIFEYTATNGQTVFSGLDDNSNTLAYTPGHLIATLNGSTLHSGEYTATNGTSITLNTGAGLNYLLVVYAFDTGVPGGVAVLNDLTDVFNSSPADKHVLIYDGVTDNRYENRALVEADISDLQSYSLTTHNHTGVYEPVFSKNTGFNLDLGTGAGTVSEGNHTHSGLAPAGGTVGQVLKKDTATDYDYSWQDEAGGGATVLNDLTDVFNSTPADKHVLVYDGVTDNRYENRALVEADISDLQSYSLSTHNHSGVYEPVFSKNTGFNLNLGTGAGTVSEGNHTHAYVPTSRQVNSGTGLTGGGDLTTNRTLALDINGLTADATPDGAADYVATYDASGTTHKKVLLDNLPGGGSGQMLGSATTKAIFYNAQTIAENITISATQNAMSSGPITINNTYTVTISAGGRWVIV